MMKYLAVIPVALLFILATNPSEFAASLNRIGISYNIGYAVAIALRYIPDVQDDFSNTECTGGEGNRNDRESAAATPH